MPLFKIDKDSARQLKKISFGNEKALQTLIENNLEALFNVRFVKTEHATGKKHGGRIDTLGVDESGAPVIIEYKWREDQNVMNQGLYYLDWLMDHRGDFQVLVEDKLGGKNKIDWSRPRLILLAESFNKFDVHAINRMSEFIELWTYSLHTEDVLEIKLVGCAVGAAGALKKIVKSTTADEQQYDLEFHLNKTKPEIAGKFIELRDAMLEWPDVEERANQKSGVTYRTTKPFSRFESRRNSLDILLREPKYQDPLGLVRDITTHEWGYKGLIKVVKDTDIEAVLDLIKQSYEETL